MNRVLKFKVWNNVQKAWNIPNFQCDKNGVLDPGDFEVFKFCQFTGLLDKNGKEIFEGDILSEEVEQDKDCWTEENPMYIKKSKVIFKNGKFTTDYDDVLPLELSVSNSEIIGNIFENPELLK